VKHFKWVESEHPGEKRRIHQKPTDKEIHLCKGWLHAELKTLKPELIVCLGASAASALLGSGFRLNHSRGRLFSLPEHPAVLATWHPSAVLRATGPQQEKLRRELVADLRLAASVLEGGARPAGGVEVSHLGLPLHGEGDAP
jgi:uracil-DNA glycosylase family 4